MKRIGILLVVFPFLLSFVDLSAFRGGHGGHGGHRGHGRYGGHRGGYHRRYYGADAGIGFAAGTLTGAALASASQPSDPYVEELRLERAEDRAERRRQEREDREARKEEERERRREEREQKAAAKRNLAAEEAEEESAD